VRYYVFAARPSQPADLQVTCAALPDSLSGFHADATGTGGNGRLTSLGGAFI
jgi:hypothetical protein